MQLPLHALADDRVPGVVAALKAHDRVGLLGEQVGDLSLSLVAPLGADDHDSGHGRRSVGGSPPAPSGGSRDDLELALSLVSAEERQWFAADLLQARDRAQADLLG